MKLKPYFYHVRHERLANYLLLCTTMVIFFSPQIYSYFRQTKSYDLRPYQSNILAFEAQLQLEDSLQREKYQYVAKSKAPYEKKYQNKQKPYPLSQKNKKQRKAIQYSNFEPNTVDEATLQALGLEERTIKSIVNFRKKGGKFRVKADFKKIYTLALEDYERLLPYIDLPDTLAKFSPTIAEKREEKIEKPFQEKSAQEKSKVQLSIEINSADAATLQQLYGIGATWSARIIKYRTALGGFKSVEQLAEIYNFPDSTYQKILPFVYCDSTKADCLSLNEASFETLAAHPYLSNYQARAILKWREELGGFKRTDFIFTLPELDDNKKTASKIFPYLCL